MWRGAPHMAKTTVNLCVLGCPLPPYIKEQGQKERGWRTEKRGRIKRQGRSGGEENGRQMANNVMREIGIVMGTWYVDFCTDSPATAPEILLATS